MLVELTFDEGHGAEPDGKQSYKSLRDVKREALVASSEAIRDHDCDALPYTMTVAAHEASREIFSIKMTLELSEQQWPQTGHSKAEVVRNAVLEQFTILGAGSSEPVDIMKIGIALGGRDFTQDEVMDALTHLERSGILEFVSGNRVKLTGR